MCKTSFILVWWFSIRSPNPCIHVIYEQKTILTPVLYRHHMHGVLKGHSFDSRQHYSLKIKKKKNPKTKCCLFRFLKLPVMRALIAFVSLLNSLKPIFIIEACLEFPMNKCLGWNLGLNHVDWHQCVHACWDMYI